MAGAKQDEYGDASPSLLSRFMRRALLWFYRRQKWTAVGEIPEPRRFVIVAAPHTSNWDFLYFIGLTGALGIHSHFMAKSSLFKWPFRNFLLQMGGIPVKRKSSHNYVQQMIDEFGRRDEFILTIAPEGTRSNVKQWRTGFYHIAHGAGVPIVVGMMDYGKKTGGLGAVVMPTGDYEADMKKIGAFYNSVTPRHPDKTMDDIVAVALEQKEKS
ncbi:lysophospholipid acyltransferase family protein [Sphingorhabdus sp. Alg239-R122]|uniref:lysophospholipid acyltransferase family protein n=1 Tax=Sphingorhabdus sp. Alg239-R122 TaxID=2305989 RepID=UPI0013D9612D|nr:lysophospholipid acyltransferase family protein [Sphingorhabdus sp. Alg239-R122]